MAGWPIQLSPHTLESLKKDERVPLLISFILCVLLVLLVMQFVDSFRKEHQVITTVKSQPIIPPPANIADLHLFGTYEAVSTEMPVTTQFKLEGTVVFVANPTESQALIAVPGRPAKTYKVNEALPGNIIVTHIEKDYVVIDNNGSREKILLPVDSLLQK